MKLKVKDMDIATGGVMVTVLNEKDAAKMDLKHADRIKIRCKKKEVVTVVDISESSKAVPIGKIGLFEEVLDKLNVKHNSIVHISRVEKPNSIHLIKKKLDGGRLNYHEFKDIIDDIVNDRLLDIETTYFVSSSYSNGLTMEEIVNLTKAMVDTGDKVNFKGKNIMDLHCIGGVPNNRTTLIVIPIVAAAGLKIPKTSSRAITSPAGTADTLEVLCNVSLPIEKMKKVIDDTNGCIVWGGAINLAPADDKIIQIEHPLSIDAEGQMLASIMAKKHSVGVKKLLMDLPSGRQTKCKSKADALHLKDMFLKIGKRLGMEVKVVITDGSQPIGNGIGPVLEINDVMAILQMKDNAPSDLKEKSLILAGLLIEMGGKCDKGHGYHLAKTILEDGLAYRKFKEIIEAQGKNKPKDIPKLGTHTHIIRAKKSGKIKHIDNKIIAKIARVAGAPKDYGAGIYIYKKLKEKINKGETLYKIYTVNKTMLKYAIKEAKLHNGYTIE